MIIRELGECLFALGIVGVELATHPTNPMRIRHRPATLPDALVLAVLDHRNAILDLLNDGYSPTEPEAVYIYFERLGIGDDLGMPTHSGSPAWLIAVGESMRSRYCDCRHDGNKGEVTAVDQMATQCEGKHSNTKGCKRMQRKQRSGGTGSLIRRTPSGSYIAKYFDYTGKRRERSTRTTDHATALRILAKCVADTALRREGVIDPRSDRFQVEGRKPIAAQLDAYFLHCQTAGLKVATIRAKQRQLQQIVTECSATRLSELTCDAVERFLASRKALGRGAQTVNDSLAMVMAFYNWCVKTGRADANPLRVARKQNVLRDRRRVRRALTPDEMTRLLKVARVRGREAWYLAAAFAGLRRSDLSRLTWSAIDFNESTITISDGKAKRCDIIPMHPQLADALQRRKQANPALPTARVWSSTVGNLTRQKDFERAGIAARDEAGRVADLHALRTTLGTMLARAGVAPQIAQRIMRHSDYRTTLAHYTVLGLTDTASAMAKLPTIAANEWEANAATGTNDATASDARATPNDPHQPPHLKPHQLGCDAVQNGAFERNNSARVSASSKNTNVLETPQNPLVFKAKNRKPPMGLEPTTYALRKHCSTTQSTDNAMTYDLASNAPTSTPTSWDGMQTKLPPVDADLVALFEAWATLPAVIKVGIMAMVKAGK